MGEWEEKNGLGFRILGDLGLILTLVKNHPPAPDLSVLIYKKRALD